MDDPERSAILIVSSTSWAFPAKLAVAFAGTGVIVDAVCGAHSPLKVARSVRRTFRYSAIDPLGVLRNAIVLARPALIVPCDDRVMGHLHSLHADCRARAPEIAEVIQRSLGKPESFGIAERRSDLIALARELGICAPLTLRVETRQELALGVLQVGLPAIMKVDGTWGGIGVRLVHTAEQAASAFTKLSRPLSASRAVVGSLLGRDTFFLPSVLRHERPVVNVQRFVSGRPANCTVACWKGEVLSYIGATVLSASSEFGASRVVRIVNHVSMRRAAETLVRRLGLSGFCGFDFMIDAEGVAHLIEMNARPTPLTHLALGCGRDPVAALSSIVLGTPCTRMPVTSCDVISFFPQALDISSPNALPRVSFHDVPWEEPELVRELVRCRWPERGMLATLVRWVKRRAGFPRRKPSDRPSYGDGVAQTAKHSIWGVGGENWGKAQAIQPRIFSGRY